MDDETKRSAMKKADSIRPHLGYPDFILNETSLNEYYSAVSDEAASSLIFTIATVAGPQAGDELLRDDGDAHALEPLQRVRVSVETLRQRLVRVVTCRCQRLLFAGEECYQ